MNIENQTQEQSKILTILNELKGKSSNAAIYLVALLFAIELNSLWLIITLSVFLIIIIRI